MQVMGGGLRQRKMSATPHKMQSALERAQTTGELSTHIEGVLQISSWVAGVVTNLRLVKGPAEMSIDRLKICLLW